MGTAIFPTGSTTIFKQSTAPVGWTKITTYNNYTLRIVSGSVSTGGTIDFSTAMVNTIYTGVAGPSLDPNNPNFSVNSQAVLAAIPAHSHPAPTSRSFASGTALPAGPAAPGLNARLSSIGIGSSQSGPSEGGSTHSHAITGSTTFAGGSKNFGVNYFDVIIASID